MGTAGPQPQAPDLSDLELAAEVRQCPLTSGVQLIKSRDPHLAGGERNTIDKIVNCVSSSSLHSAHPSHPKVIDSMFSQDNSASKSWFLLHGILGLPSHHLYPCSTPQNPTESKHHKTS